MKVKSFTVYNWLLSLLNLIVELESAIARKEAMSFYKEFSRTFFDIFAFATNVFYS